MRAVAHLAGEFPSLSTQLIVDLIGNKELPGRERPWGFFASSRRSQCSSRYKYGIFTQFALKSFRQESRLDLK